MMILRLIKTVKKNWIYLLVTALSGVIGIYILTPGYVNPINWSWVQFSQPATLDVATSVAAQIDFYKSNLSLGGGNVHHYGFPVGTSLLQTATVAIPMYILKVVSLFIHFQGPIQLSGLTVWLSYVLAGLILVLLLKSEGSSNLISIMAVPIMLLIPKFFNSWAEPSLSWIWIILLGGFLYRNALMTKFSKRICSWFLIGLLSASTHSYFVPIMASVLISMSIEMYLCKKRIIPELQIGGVFILGVCAGTWLSGGYGIGLAGSATDVTQVGPYATDVFGFFSTFGQSALLPAIKHQPSFEGLSYPGFGILLLIAVPLISGLSKIFWSKQMSKKSSKLNASKKLNPRSLIIACTFLYAYAIGPSFVLDGTQHMFPWPHKILMLFSIFRASGRMAWPLMLLLFIGAIKHISKKQSHKSGYLLMALALSLQILDTFPSAKVTHTYINQVTDSRTNKLPLYNATKDLYFIPGYPDPATAPWRGQVFQTIQQGGKIHYFAYSGRYSSSTIGNSINESINLVRNPKFEKGSVVFVRKDFSDALLLKLKVNGIGVEILQTDKADWIKFKTTN